jgi:pimeloyl-ACP methyl ester carboxylesterase
MGGELIARRFAAKLPNATLEMIPGGHAVWVDDPQRVAASIRRFCHQASPDVAPQSV